MFPLAICLTYVSSILLHFDFPHGEKFTRGFVPAGIFAHGDIFCRVFILRGIYSMAKYFSAFDHIYTLYGLDPAQLLHVAVKQASKL